MRIFRLFLGLGIHLIGGFSFAGSLTLNQKLNLQFELYEKARTEIAERTGRQGGMITRDEWEKILALPGDQAFTTEDIQALNARQLREEQTAHLLAQRKSVINLDTFRSDPARVKAFCAELPKGGMLHIHLTGTANLPTVKKLLATLNPVLSYDQVNPLLQKWFYPGELDFLKSVSTPTSYLLLSDEMKEQVSKIFVLPPGNHPFTRFLGLFVIQSLFKADHDKMVNIMMEDFLARAHQEHVRYVEFANAATDYPISSSTLPDLEASVQRWKKEFDIDTRFNFAFNRTLDAEANRQRTCHELLAMRSSTAITGIDLLSNENLNPALEKGQTIYATVLASVLDGHSQLHRTMHSGEFGDPRDPRDALILSEGLGHAVLLTKDPVALEYARRLKTRLEINLVSNLRLENISDLRKHPFLSYLRLGLRPSLSTDDEGMFETDINREYEEAILNSDITYAELKQMVFNSIEASFADPTTKRALLKKLVRDFRVFEAKYATIAEIGLPGAPKNKRPAGETPAGFFDFNF